jgi:hypothetical protein
MKLVYKISALVLVGVIGFALNSTYGALIGSAVLVPLMFAAFEYIARNDVGDDSE